MQRTLRKLIEIRLCHASSGVHEAAEIRPLDCLWIPDNAFNRARLGRAVELGNNLYGHQTHWIEQRQA